MKTLEQQETEVILKMFEQHDLQRETIFKMGKKIYELELKVKELQQRLDNAVGDWK